MWKAEKIELKKNDDGENSDLLYFSDCYSLSINDECISNTLGDCFSLANSFQDYVCTYCGVEGCNSGGYLCLVRHNDSLLVIPDFECMENDFEEYDFSTENGNNCCPPHKWYEDGVLIVEGEKLNELLYALKGMRLEKIPFVTTEQLDLILDWENAVKEKPKGFMRIDE